MKLTDEEADRAVVNVIRSIFKMAPLYGADGSGRTDAERFETPSYGDRWREIHRRNPDNSDNSR